MADVAEPVLAGDDGAGAAVGVGKRRRQLTDAVSGLLVLAQSALLLSGFHMARAIPTGADRAVGERLAAGMRLLGGTISVAADPGLSLLAGMTPSAHEDAVADVLRAADQAAIAGVGVGPLSQRVAGQACGADEDHALHGPTGEVHRRTCG